MKIFKIIMYELARIYWRIFRPKTLGARMLLVNDNKVLLVKHTYQHRYFLPGGGVSYGEEIKEALMRELKEELSLEIKEMELFGIYQSNIEGKRDTIVIFLSNQAIEIKELSCLDGEIEEVIMADINNLPVKTAPGTKKRIEEYKANNYPNTGAW